MPRTIICTLGLTVALTMITGCIDDDSAPNRRGLERPALIPTNQKDKDNAEHRTLETPKRELPSDAGKEFPGQTRLTTTDTQTLFLDISTIPADTTPATDATTAPTTAPATTEVLATAPSTVPTTMPPATPDETSINYTSKTPMQINENQPLARRGEPMPVPGTGEIIPADWGTVQPLASYPHRPWSKTKTDFISGEVKHNPTYYVNLFEHPQYSTQPPAVQVLEDYAEVPWFFGETIALPVLMICEPPLIQKTTRNDGTDPIYHGQLPALGAIQPAPLPGVIKWEYPFTNAQSVPEIEASSLPSPLLTPGVTPPATVPATQPAGNK